MCDFYYIRARTRTDLWVGVSSADGRHHGCLSVWCWIHLRCFWRRMMVCFHLWRNAHYTTAVQPQGSDVSENISKRRLQGWKENRGSDKEAARSSISYCWWALPVVLQFYCIACALVCICCRYGFCFWSAGWVFFCHVLEGINANQPQHRKSWCNSQTNAKWRMSPASDTSTFSVLWMVQGLQPQVQTQQQNRVFIWSSAVSESSCANYAVFQNCRSTLTFSAFFEKICSWFTTSCSIVKWPSLLFEASVHYGVLFVSWCIQDTGGEAATNS